MGNSSVRASKSPLVLVEPIVERQKNFNSLPRVGGGISETS